MSRVSVEPRIAERRRKVREEGARRSVRRVVRTLALAAVLGVAAWLAQSPLLSVSEIEVRGARHADVEGALAEAGVEAGVSTVLVRAVRADRLRAALEADPWVARAEVWVDFPVTVEVDVEERRPVARVADREGGWWLVTEGGVVVAEEAGEGARAEVRLEVDAAPGERIEDQGVLGSLEFLASLPPDLREGAWVVRQEGELWATVGGYRVRLGLPIDMPAKAVALEAMLESGIEEGAVVDLLTPARPAIRQPSSTG